MKYPEGPNPSKSEDANDRGYAERRVVDVNVEKIFKPQTPDSRFQTPGSRVRVSGVPRG